MSRTVLAMIAKTTVCFAVVATTAVVEACPFSNAVQPTLAGEIASTDVSVVCKLVRPPRDDSANNAGGQECVFEVVEVLKGQAHLGASAPGAKPQTIRILYLDDKPLGTRSLASTPARRTLQ